MRTIFSQLHQYTIAMVRLLPSLGKLKVLNWENANLRPGR